MKKQQYVNHLSRRLTQLREQVADLEDRADHAETQSDLPSYPLLEQLREREETVREMLQKLELIGEDAWSKLRPGADSAWKSLEDTFEAVRETFDALTEEVGARGKR